jgi:hypothetical protein
MRNSCAGHDYRAETTFFRVKGWLSIPYNNENLARYTCQEHIREVWKDVS